MRLDGRDFNLASEEFYRETLRIRHLEEALSIAGQEVAAFSKLADGGDPYCRRMLQLIMQDLDPGLFLNSVRKNVVEERVTAEVLSRLIQLVLVVLERFGRMPGEESE